MVDIRVSNFLFRFPSFAETKAQIRGPSEYIHSSSTLKLSCRVYLGPRGPDEDYARTAVIHWFHEQRLLGMYNFIKTCLQFKFKNFLGQKKYRKYGTRVGSCVSSPVSNAPQF